MTEIWCLEIKYTPVCELNVNYVNWISLWRATKRQGHDFIKWEYHWDKNTHAATTILSLAILWKITFNGIPWMAFSLGCYFCKWKLLLCMEVGYTMKKGLHGQESLYEQNTPFNHGGSFYWQRKLSMALVRMPYIVSINTACVIFLFSYLACLCAVLLCRGGSRHLTREVKEQTIEQ